MEPLKRLAMLARESAERIVACLDTLQALHSCLMEGFQEFLSFDPSGIDESAAGLAQSCEAFFRDSERLLAGDGLQGALHRMSITGIAFGRPESR